MDKKFYQAEWNARHVVGTRITKTVLLTLIVIFALGMALPNPASAWQMDIPLDQALVLEGGESTNPRQYDPIPRMVQATSASLADWSRSIRN